MRPDEVVLGKVMLAARKSSTGETVPEMFDDIPVLQRKWQAALRPGEKLPPYEDVMLGSLGRLGAISGLGRSLNITTTAEGMETLEQLDWLRNEGCNEVQGFLFSAAKPATEIGTLLARFGHRASKAA
jgi:EAL domain